MRCRYDFADFYIFSNYYSDDDFIIYHGIIMGFDPNRAWGPPYEIFYTVLCLDGLVRYFVDWEIELISSSEEKGVDKEE